MLVLTHGDRCLEEVPAHAEIARALQVDRPLLVNLLDWDSARQVVRRVVAELK